MDDNNDIKRSVYTPPESDLLKVESNDSDPVKAYIGPKNTGYFMQKFKAFENTGSSVSWNWPAFFLTWPWLFYRKMWAHGLFYIFGISIASSLIGKLLKLVISGDMAEGIEVLLLMIFAFVIYPMYANKIYYNHINNKIQQFRAAGMPAEDIIVEMEAKGGTSRVAVIVILLLGLASLGILLSIAIPEYQQYIESQ